MKYLIDYENKIIFKEVDEEIYGVPLLRVLIKDREGCEKLYFDKYTMTDYKKYGPYEISYKYEFDEIYDLLEEDYKKADELVKDLFKGKTDKGGHDYYENHLKKVSYECDTIQAKIVALLHDILEDCDLKYEDIESQFGSVIARSVKELTKPSTKHEYYHYIDKIDDVAALEVKKQDLIQNMDLSRLKEITEKDEQRKKKYEHALFKVNKKLDIYKYKQLTLTEIANLYKLGYINLDDDIKKVKIFKIQWPEDLLDDGCFSSGNGNSYLEADDVFEGNYEMQDEFHEYVYEVKSQDGQFNIYDERVE